MCKFKHSFLRWVRHQTACFVPSRRTLARLAAALPLLALGFALPLEALAAITGATAIPTTGLFIELYTLVRGILGGFLGLTAAAVAGIVGVWSIAAGGRFVQGMSFLAIAVVAGFAPSLLEQVYLALI